MVRYKNRENCLIFLFKKLLLFNLKFIMSVVLFREMIFNILYEFKYCTLVGYLCYIKIFIKWFLFLELFCL